MKANYHTHTARCGHALGTDEAYVLAAVEQKFDVLGFSDHVPWPYTSGYTHPHVRMHISQLDDYVSSIRALREKYAEKITLKIGFECEYFPDYMSWLADMKQEKAIDYLILGNHYEATDENGMYFGNASTPNDLIRYVNSAVKGIQTGMFSYLAHPDLFMRGYAHFDADCRAVARDLIAACKAKNLPMEYNLHDRFRGEAVCGESYPNRDFFEMVAAEGVPIMIGLDAHEPAELANPAQYKRALKEREEIGGNWVDSVTLL